ncbi:lytic transglycosylase domain-containing protein [Endobacterium cereale]|uniref:lytic transglycosylase domain-containing protein n=1 Tax=Endobacterium cereale TaxID=2663029 RepID=UPI002B469D51|nr:lytic transglycosylase domain-containing protein [Endobacterium cereale]MEB2846857.1 lytic transglycosylase domain-containing protein [Endobacterium cereale]
MGFARRSVLLTGSALLFLAGVFGPAEAAQPTGPPDKNKCLYERPDASPTLCIRRETFNTDLCRTIEHFARAHAVPPAFFARLIWRESLFRPEAVSPKGAEGIAQFMPGTARMRGLSNSFDAIEALDASANYLGEMKTRFGNFGYAAAAYNAGENGLGRFLSNERLPIETRDYVFAITGATIEMWRDKPPETAAPELDEKRPFLEACTVLADTRRMNEPVFAGSADWAPWGVQLAAHYRPAIVDQLFTRAILRLPEPLNVERALIVRQRGGNFGYRPRYAARIGRETREEADKLCAAIKAVSVPCTVFRNR